MMNNQNQNRANISKTPYLLIIIALLAVNAFGGWAAMREWMITQQTIREVNYGYAVMTATPETWFGTAVPEIIIQEQPAVIVVTGEPPTYEQPSVPVVEPAPVATAVPTHPPLPGSMKEAADLGYWPMPITPQQYEQCVANPAANPACQFYVKGD